MLRCVRRNVLVPPELGVRVMQVAIWLAVAVGLQTAGATEPLVLENASAQPFVYYFHHGFQKNQEVPWTSPVTIPAGERRTVGSAVPLVIGFRHGWEWKSFALKPGCMYRVRADGEGRSMLYFAGEAQALPLVREIKVLAVADSEYRVRFPEWQERVRGLIAAASRCYECEFGIRFAVVDCKAWNFNTRYERSIQAQLVGLQEVELGPADLMVAFVRCMNPMGKGSAIGWGMRLSPYALVTDSWPELADIIPLAYREKIWKEPGFGSTVTLVHELGHTLGAFHLADVNSIMYPNPVKMIPPRIQFDDVTRQVIQAMRGTDLRQGPIHVPRATALKIRELYKAHRLVSEPPDGDPISSAFLDRARQAQASRDPGMAAHMSLRAENWWREGGKGHTVGYASGAGPQ